MAANTRSKQQVKSEVASTLESDKVLLVTQSVDDSDDDHKKQSNKDVQYMLENWNAYREYQQEKLGLFKLLTEEDMSNIDQWLLDLDQMYEELQYPTSHRVWQTIIYLQDDERLWYEREK